MATLRITEDNGTGFDRAARCRQFDLDENLERFCALDIECVKVAAPKGWPQSTRFKTFMIGVGSWEPASRGRMRRVVQQLANSTVDRSTDPFWGNSKAILKWPNLDQEGVWEHNRLDVLEVMVRAEKSFPIKIALPKGGR